MTTSQNNFLIIIAGPTAAGKTAMSIEIAKIFNTEIISADSRQFYRELNTGTAKPSESELKQVKHHFINNLSVADYYNVYKFENEVILTLDKLFRDNPHAVMVGGSGLYINAVCNGIDELPDADEKLRNELNLMYKNEGITALQNKLKELDPQYYSDADIANPNRLIRGIEVCLITGQTYTSLKKRKNKDRNFKPVKIGLNLDRKELYEKINNRVDLMMQYELLEEAEKMYEFRHLNALNTVGYKELFEYLDKKVTLDEAVENIKQNTRKYAKRQITWFKKDSSIKWFHPDNKEDVIKYIKFESNYEIK